MLGGMASGEIGGTRISSDDGTEIGWHGTGSGPGPAGLLGRAFTVLADTGATFLFGHGYAGPIAAETLLRTPDTGIDALALSEPGVASGARYTGVAAETLLPRGARSPDHLRDTVDLLPTRLPEAQVAVLPKVGHNAPDLDAPRAVAEQLLAFFGRDR
jgi:pimeloyl-ACP methyl ester carboxylesterase